MMKLRLLLDRLVVVSVATIILHAIRHRYVVIVRILPTSSGYLLVSSRIHDYEYSGELIVSSQTLTGALLRSKVVNSMCKC